MTDADRDDDGDTCIDEETLREMYHGEEKSLREIADDVDRSYGWVRQRCIEYGIDRRPSNIEKDSAVWRIPRDTGKVDYATGDGDGKAWVGEHQLVALLEFDPHDVFADGVHVHHEMGAPVDINVPENLALMGAGEHARAHRSGTATTDPEVTLAFLRDDWEPRPDLHPDPDTDAVDVAEYDVDRERLARLRTHRSRINS